MIRLKHVPPSPVSPQAHDSPVRAMTWSHNDMWMLTADHGGYVKYWQSNMNNVKMFQAHKEAIREARFLPNLPLSVVGSHTGALPHGGAATCCWLWLDRCERVLLLLMLCLLSRFCDLLNKVISHCSLCGSLLVWVDASRALKAQNQ